MFISVEKKCFIFTCFYILVTICLLFYSYRSYTFCFGDKLDSCDVNLGNVIRNLVRKLNATSFAYQQVPPLLEQRHGRDDPPTRFLYLTQTEQCLPDQLKLAIGNPSTCQCDVVVLSYKKKCKEDSHHKYIYVPTTTWTTGRNLLFYTFIHNMTNRQERYLYYIMIDDDIEIQWIKELKSTFSTKNPWRSYEAFLRRVRPPIAALKMNGMYFYMIENTHQKKHCSIHPEYNPTVYMDPAVAAYHYQAVEHVLPYWSKLDKVTWWYSNIYNYIWNDLSFHGQVVVHKQLMGFNPKHRPYPRKPVRLNLISSMVTDIEQKLSKQCRKVMATLLQQHKTKGMNYHTGGSPIFCHPPPKPNQIIIPFKECTTV